MEPVAPSESESPTRIGQPSVQAPVPVLAPARVAVPLLPVSPATLQPLEWRWCFT